VEQLTVALTHAPTGSDPTRSRSRPTRRPVRRHGGNTLLAVVRLDASAHARRRTHPVGWIRPPWPYHPTVRALYVRRTAGQRVQQIRARTSQRDRGVGNRSCPCRMARRSPAIPWVYALSPYSNTPPARRCGRQSLGTPVRPSPCGLHHPREPDVRSGLGDLPQGNGDQRLAISTTTITPNAHAIAGAGPCRQLLTSTARSRRRPRVERPRVRRATTTRKRAARLLQPPQVGSDDGEGSGRSPRCLSVGCRPNVRGSGS